MGKPVVWRADQSMPVRGLRIEKSADCIARNVLWSDHRELHVAVAINIDLITRGCLEPQLPEACGPVSRQSVDMHVCDRHATAVEFLLKLSLGIAMGDPFFTVRPRVNAELGGDHPPDAPRFACGARQHQLELEMLGGGLRSHHRIECAWRSTDAAPRMYLRFAHAGERMTKSATGSLLVGGSAEAYKKVVSRYRKAGLSVGQGARLHHQ